MKKFISNILIFIGSTIIVAAIIQVIITLRIEHRTINGQDNFHFIQGQKNDIIFLGSSRCTEHFDPGFFKDSLGLKCVNLGVNGHGDITAQWIKLNYYLASNPPPKMVLLNFDPISTYGPYDVSKNTNVIGKQFYARYAFGDRRDNKLISDYFHFNFAEKYIPLFALLRYRSVLECITQSGGKTWLKYGYQKYNQHWDTLNAPCNIKYYEAGSKIYIRDRDSIKAHMAFFNSYCLKNNIKLICVQSPVFKSIYFRDAYDATKAICDELGIMFIDTNQDSITHDVGNFTDADHLNSDGVPKMLNIIIKNELFLAEINRQKH